MPVDSDALAAQNRACLDARDLPGVIGELTHHVRSPLAIMMALADLCRLQLAEDDTLDRDTLARNIDTLLDSARYTERILRAVRTFADNHRIEPERCSVNELVAEACAMVRDDYDDGGAVLSCELPDDEIFADADPARMQLALMAVLSNGAEALSDGGTATVTVRRAESDVVEITVTDTGHGISEASLPRVFDPFFTIRQEAPGLGLTVARQIINAHRGLIWVDSRPEQGTQVTITLPALVGVEVLGQPQDKEAL